MAATNKNSTYKKCHLPSRALNRALLQTKNNMGQAIVTTIYSSLICDGAQHRNGGKNERD